MILMILHSVFVQNYSQYSNFNFFNIFFKNGGNTLTSIHSTIFFNQQYESNSYNELINGIMYTMSKTHIFFSRIIWNISSFFLILRI